MALLTTQKLKEASVLTGRRPSRTYRGRLLFEGAIDGAKRRLARSMSTISNRLFKVSRPAAVALGVPSYETAANPGPDAGLNRPEPTSVATTQKTANAPPYA